MIRYIYIYIYVYLYIYLHTYITLSLWDDRMSLTWLLCPTSLLIPRTASEQRQWRMLYHAHWLWHFRWGRWNLIWSYLIIFMFSLFCFAVPNTALNAWWFNNFGITPCVLQFAGDIPKSWPGQTAKHPLTAPKSLSLPNDPLQENKSCVSLLYSTWMMSGDQNMVVNSVCIHILQSLWKFHRRWVDWSCSIHVWYFVVWLVNGFWGLICCAVSTSRSIGKNCHLQMFNLHHVCHPARQFNQCEIQHLHSWGGESQKEARRLEMIDSSHSIVSAP